MKIKKSLKDDPNKKTKSAATKPDSDSVNEIQASDIDSWSTTGEDGDSVG